MATRPNRRRAGRAGARRRGDGTPAWALVLAGLAVGAAAVATGFYVRDKLAPAAAPGPGAAAEKPAAPRKPRPPPKPSDVPPEKEFEFYDMLPNFEVVVPEEDGPVRADKTPAPVEAPGVYVLQAGSYSTFAEADKAKAQLALLGIKSQIQRITVDEREYHRVRIGPVEKLDELNRLRQRLRTARIDYITVRVGE